MYKHQATIKEIAQVLKVSISTVSRALRDDPRIGYRTRMRVKDLAEKLHYVPNLAARFLSKHQTYTIGVVLPHLQEEFFSLAITGIEDALADTGYNVIIAQSRNQYQREIKAVRAFINTRVDGVISSLSAETTDYQHFSELNEFGIPVVFFDRIPIDLPSHKVRSDVEQGMGLVMDFLMGKGFSRIALLNGPAGLQISQERLTGYQEALKRSGKPINEDLIKFTDFSKEDIERKMEELCLKNGNRPEAIFAFSDYVALLAMKWCKQNGLRPNEDIVFASFANLPITNYLDNPPAASVEQFAYKMGQHSAQLLLEILQKKHTEKLEFREIIVPTQLVVH
jgi:DNA-binding LacI/PurR family transcriptional regulator